MEQFKDNHLINIVKRTIVENNMKPNQLKLEITESISMNQDEFVIDKLNQLKETGVQLALDDFGTGYSSLHYLSAFPIDYLKVDQSFTRSITSPDQNAVIMQSIIQMAKGLGLKIVIEGVETGEQWTFSKNMGCDEYQGFYFSKPLDEKFFEEIYKNHQPRLSHYKQERVSLV
jgi:EAL domain-containing protein (putative c-di-GMP-specific phosphodiesterase class I)